MVQNKIVLIGAGNVATHLGKALQDVGYHIAQIYSRTETSASALGNLLGVAYTTSLDTVCTDADIYVVALKDSVLQSLLPSIVKGRESALFVHTAGSLPMDVWKCYACHYGVLYPMQTFSKHRKVDFVNVPFFVEANGTVELELLKRMASSLSPKVYEINSEQRKYLHMAAVFACNFTNHMYALCDQLLSEHDIPFEVMIPLIDETARKVHDLKPVEAQTGPAVRYDENVINYHLSMLQDKPDMCDLYERISKSIHKTNDKL